MSRLFIDGGVVHPKYPRPVGDQWLLEFQLATASVVWNPDTQKDEVVSAFWSVEWMADASGGDLPLLNRGDKVSIIGELVQKKTGAKGESHTRIRVHFLTWLRRARPTHSDSFVTRERRFLPDEPLREPPEDRPPW